eukprot:SAG31_NODE_741_length_12429_cov_13.571127_2_plen_72_part_00
MNHLTTQVLKSTVFHGGCGRVGQHWITTRAAKLAAQGRKAAATFDEEPIKAKIPILEPRNEEPLEGFVVRV